MQAGAKKNNTQNRPSIQTFHYICKTFYLKKRIEL